MNSESYLIMDHIFVRSSDSEYLKTLMYHTIYWDHLETIEIK